MGKGKPRAVEKGALAQSSIVSSSGLLDIQSGPVYYPTEDEFKDPLEFIDKIRPEAEPYGICKIVPPGSWKPPFALDLDSFTFPTKTQAIHQLQARPASCDPKTFELEYNRFLEEHCGKKSKKKIVFEGVDLDLCKLFNAVKRYGGYDKVVEEKKWGEVSRFVRSGGKISECAKHVLCQLYREHLCDYEKYYKLLNQQKVKNYQGGMHGEMKNQLRSDFSSSKRRRKNLKGESVKSCKVEEEERDQICEQCVSGLHGEVMLLCDRCNKGWHIYCLSPPLKQVPLGNWYCLECLNSDKDTFGFVPGKQFALEAFRRVAERAKKKWFGSSPTSRVQLEKKFWEIVEGSAGAVEVMYGSDLDTSVYGSGFPRGNGQRPASIEVEKWEEYCASPWNLNNLPKLRGSMLRTVHYSIAGVMVPWLYVGMLFSSFCWHFEDHCFYSMNYLHWGEPKYWYSVPGNEAKAFEKVMRKSLPDLFEAQPDLLFQLVTMLNPSVLQENGVPVYSVLQEPGNFVITFPRSYHGGFNFGLNCAEAVNFAPADWLPHGGFGAELYQLYRKAAVLSHEELLCAVSKVVAIVASNLLGQLLSIWSHSLNPGAESPLMSCLTHTAKMAFHCSVVGTEMLYLLHKSDFDIKASPYLKKELHRIYDKEKSLRERLWRNGIVSSSRMSPRKHPEYVGTEEDPTCIICQQYLYLSAVVCRCRPSSFVCLEHWENLCECKPSRHRLLYRHSLAELKALPLMIDKHDCWDTVQDRILRRQLLSCDDSGSLTKKAIKGGQVTFSRLAEEWILNACKIFKMPYSGEAYVKALKKAEQFLWAGSEMDPVRDVTRNLLEAKRWAEGVRDCLSKVEKWSAHRSCDTEKVKWEHVENLLSCDSVPCNEPALVKLKDYEKEARALSQSISSALSKGSQISISDWEILSTRVRHFPISLKESKRLVQRLSSANVWVENVRKCVSEKSSAAVEAHILYQLQSEILELPLQPPEVEMLMGLLRQVEICQAQCEDMLKGSINLKNVEALLLEWDDFTINIPELKLLKQYRSDAISWISRWNEVVINIHEREDQENVVSVLSSIQRDGELLKIQVDELSLVEIELKKARCRVKALKSLGNKMSLDFIQQLMMDATVLQIEEEGLFGDISGVLSAAMFWEERATCILASEAQMLDYEVAIRTSEDICAILPSLDVVTDALLYAKSWLKMSEPFLVSNSSVSPASSSLLKVDNLKELVSQSKLLKISLRERSMLQTLLDNCIEWQDNACSTLHAAECFLDSEITNTGISSGLFSKVKQQVTAMESVVKAGVSLGLDFCEILKLQDACSTLLWCFKALSFSYIVPQLEEVEILMEVALNLPATYASSSLCSSLIDGLNWLKKAAKICVPSKHKKIKLSDAEEVLVHSQKIKMAFPVMVNQLFSAIKKHNSWLEQVHLFFQLKPGDRSWILLVELKELGSTDAFNCPELDMVSSEVQKVEQWKQRCQDIAGKTVGDGKSLFHALGKMKNSLDSSLYIYSQLKGHRSSKLCMCCSSNIEDQEFLTCSMCNDRYHLQCKGPTLVDTTNDLKLFLCHYCHFLDSGKISQNRGSPLLFGGKRAELNKLIELLSDTEDFSVWIEERSIINQLVKRALACKACLAEVVDFALTYHDENLSIIVEKLSIAMKAIEVAGVFDHPGSCNFEMALARHSWRVRANKLLGGPQKPLIQQIQRHLKEGLAIRIPPEDHFCHKLADMKHICTQWREKAKKVSMDSGALGLENVFELITEGENLPVQFEKELKLLRNRSMLYCICRKPYDQRDMIACDKCDEWYHFDCINLSSPPKVYICPACKLQTEDLYLSPAMTLDGSNGSKCEEPQTPSPRLVFRCKSKITKPIAKGKLAVSSDGESNMLMQSSGIEFLLWSNRKPVRRAARKRSQLDSLSQSFYIQK